jgi:predicted nucleic acid-binding protein
VILADTSVWVDHLRNRDSVLSRLLLGGQIVMHPFIVGELSLGILKERDLVISALQYLPRVATATDEEVLRFIDACALPGAGIGYVDAHLLAAARLTPGTALWTRDKRLLTVAKGLGLAADA